MSTPVVRRVGSRRGRPPKLSRDKIVQAALELGLDSFSMQGIAEHLGVTSPALYSHVAGREQVLALVNAELFEKMSSFDSAATTWREWLTDFAHAARRHLASSASTLMVNFDDPELIAALGVGERGLGLLLDAGFDPVDAGHAVWLIFRTALTAGRSAQVDLDALVAHTRETVVPEVHPRLSATNAVSEALVVTPVDDTLNFDIAILLDGLQARLDAPHTTLRGNQS